MTKAVMKLAHVTQTLVQGGVWWHLPVIPALGRQRQENGIHGQPGLHGEFKGFHSIHHCAVWRTVWGLVILAKHVLGS
jgi:hypothetical protein